MPANTVLAYLVPPGEAISTELASGSYEAMKTPQTNCAETSCPSGLYSRTVTSMKPSFFWLAFVPAP